MYPHERNGLLEYIGEEGISGVMIVTGDIHRCRHLSYPPEEGGGYAIDEWIDQTLAAKGYIQAQEDREDFILRTGAGATKFNKWMKKAGLYFNKQTGRWSRWEDR